MAGGGARFFWGFWQSGESHARAPLPAASSGSGEGRGGEEGGSRGGAVHLKKKNHDPAVEQLTEKLTSGDLFPLPTFTTIHMTVTPALSYNRTLIIASRALASIFASTILLPAH